MGFAGGRAVLSLPLPLPPPAPFLYTSFYACTYMHMCRFESMFTIQLADPMFLLQMVKFLPSAKYRYFYESLVRGKIRRETECGINLSFNLSSERPPVPDTSKYILYTCGSACILKYIIRIKVPVKHSL